MPKTIRNCFYQKLTFEKMYDAYLRARLNKSLRREVMEFEENLETNLVNLILEIKNGTYKLGKYRVFKVYEPKERVIKALPFRDRVVHQWYVHEFLLPYVVPKFIYDSYACLHGKGTHAAVRRLEKFMKECRRKYGNFYIVKMDIKKFFYTINPYILYSILKRYIKDKALLKLTELLIFDDVEKKGIPIGNYTSQYFANIYLNELDYFVKHKLKIKYYIRYMDDFVLLVKDKEEAISKFLKITNFLKEKLDLDINHKSKYYPSDMGVDFCGYRVFYTHKLIRNRSKRKIRSNIKKWKRLNKKGKLNLQNLESSFQSWKAHIKHANSYNLEKKYSNKIDDILIEYMLLNYLAATNIVIKNYYWLYLIDYISTMDD